MVGAYGNIIQLNRIQLTANGKTCLAPDFRSSLEERSFTHTASNKRVLPVPDLEGLTPISFPYKRL